MRNAIQAPEAAFDYCRKVQPLREIGPFQERLDMLPNEKAASHGRDRLRFARIGKAPDGIGAGQVTRQDARTMLRLDDFLPYRLSVASNAVSDRIAAVYRARFGLKVPEWRLIAVIAERGQATQAALVAATQMDKMTVSRAATALVARGLVARMRAGDRRTLELSLTQAGVALHAEIAPLALSIEAELLAGFSAAEREQLMALLRQLESCAKT